MTPSGPQPPRTPERIGAFVEQFFGEGNVVWPDHDPGTKTGRNLIPYLQVLHDNSDVPVVLPRRTPARSDRLTAYVIAQDRAHATVVAETLTAFVGPSYSRFDGRPALLNPADSVDRAVLDFAGPGTTFILWSPLPQQEAALWAALRRMQQTVAARPTRSWHVPKPIGRLLAEFEVALAAGDHAASAQAIEHLTSSGGLTGPNLAHLRIKRLARLGRDGELLRMPELPDVVVADPPIPVTDAVLTAVYTSYLADPVDNSDVSTAMDRLIESGHLVPALLNTNLAGLGAQALCVIALAASIRNDTSVLLHLRATPVALARIAELAPSVADLIPGAQVPGDTQIPPVGEVLPAVDHPPTSPPPHTWLDLIRALVDDAPGIAPLLDDETWRGWQPPSAADDAIAQILRGLDDTGATRAWSAVGAFIDADGYNRPATRSAQELINIALVLGNYSPGDLAGLVALTEIVLRSAPSHQEYVRLLDDLSADIDRWVGPERATVALDLADLLVRSACPDAEARLRFGLALLDPLHTRIHRLDPDQVAFASQLSNELDTGLDWAAGDAVPEEALPPLDASSPTVLLYSLDEGALGRTADTLCRIAPRCRIHRSSERVGSARLHQQAHNADVVVLATRCATHAATGFIRSSTRTAAIIAEADGSGSASLLRAAVKGLQTYQAKRTGT